MIQIYDFIKKEKFLVENGANTNIEVENKERPLLFALKNGYDDIDEYLQSFFKTSV
jgi:ankyrin repeat protein